MNVKKRIDALEQRNGGPEAEIIFFRTSYEGKEGEFTSENCLASIANGPNRGVQIESVDGEAFEEFQDRVRVVAKKESN